MRLEQSFEVAAPVEQVWETLIDIERVAPCLPGAAVTSRNDDGSYNGTFSVKIGPTSASYSGKLEMENVDPDARTATVRANGNDRRGQGGAKATIVSTLAPHDGGTRVEIVTDYSITGRLARFGRGGMIEDISERLLREFADCLQVAMGADGAADGSSGGVTAGTPGEGRAARPAQPRPAGGEAIGGISLLASVAGERARRHPTGVVAVGGVLALFVLALRRARG